MFSLVLYALSAIWILCTYGYLVWQFCAPKHRLFVAAQILFTISALTFYGLWISIAWLPPPGMAVALIAVIAATMSIHGDMSGGHKALWMLIIGAFLVVELLAIRHSELEQAKQQQNALREEREHFGEIGQGIEKAIKTSDREFRATIGKTNDVLTSITGGNSYAVVLPLLGSYRPDRPVPLLIENHGSRILTGVSVAVYESGVWIEATHQSMLNSIASRITVGTLHPGERTALNAQVSPRQFMKLDMPDAADPDGKDAFRVFIYITAQNFSSTEYLDFKEKPTSGWKFRYQLEKNQNAVMGNQPTKPTQYKQHVLEEIEWSEDQNNLRFKRPS